MLNSRWHKVFSDLWGNKLRTTLIVLSIAVGLFAVGTLTSGRVILLTEMARSYAEITPSDGVIRTTEPFDAGFVRAVRGMDDVAEVDARRALDVRVQVGESWRDLRIFAVEAYDAMRVDKIWPEAGAWPPPEREILIERAALAVIDAQVGDTLVIELPGERRRTLRIAGTVHDMVQVPAQFDGTPYGYIAFDTLAWFGEPYGFNELHIVARPPAPGELERLEMTPAAFVEQVVNQVKNRAEDIGLTIPLSLTVEPGMLPLDEILQAVLLLLGTLGALSLFLSIFLIINTVSAQLAQQKQQIGVMKAIGARTGQLIGMYLVMVMVYGALALLLAVPLSIVGARALSRFIAGMLNFDLQTFRIPSMAILVQVGVGLCVPVLASLPPFLSNLRVTAAQAMSTYQLGAGRFGRGLLDRLLTGERLWFTRRVVRRPLLLSLRNTFRSKGRLVLTLVTLALAGATFISVFSVQASLDQTLDELMRWWSFDASLTFTWPQRVERIQQEAQQVPGVAETDVWIQLPARRVRPDVSESGVIYLFASHPASALVRPPNIVEGRWLLPEDENAIVINAILRKEEPDVEVGDELVLKILGRERRFRVVGVSLGILAPMVYTNYPYVAQITGQVGEAGTVVMTATPGAPAEEVTAALEAHYERHGLSVSTIQTGKAEREEAQMTFGVIISLLLVMAVLLAVVGGLGLMGTMSINVLERTREIGVLRAIGAPNRGVAWVFIREGIVIGVVSWLFSALSAVPMSRWLSNAVGVPLMGVPLTFTFSMRGVWLWLLLVVVLSMVASYFPARNASRLTVREVLAYE